MICGCAVLILKRMPIYMKTMYHSITLLGLLRILLCLWLYVAPVYGSCFQDVPEDFAAWPPITYPIILDQDVGDPSGYRETHAINVHAYRKADDPCMVLARQSDVLSAIGEARSCRVICKSTQKVLQATDQRLINVGRYSNFQTQLEPPYFLRKLTFNKDKTCYDEHTPQSAAYEINPVAVLIQHKPTAMNPAPHWASGLDGRPNVQVVADVFSKIEKDLLGYGTLSGMFAAGSIAGAYYTRRSLALIPKLASSLSTVTCAFGLIVSGLLLARSWQKRRQLSQEYPFPVSDQLCGLLQISSSSRKYYRCSQPQNRELDILAAKSATDSSMPAILVKYVIS